MYINNIDSKTNFGYKTFLDIGASNPKGTLKAKVISDLGQTICEEIKGINYVNDTVNGFLSSNDFVKKIAGIVRKIHNFVSSQAEKGVIQLSQEDKKLSGVVVCIPGTTFPKDGKSQFISFMPNLRNRHDKQLVNVDFTSYVKKLLTKPKSETGVEINPNRFDFVVTKDLGGAGVALGKLMAKKGMLKEGDYVMGIMTGGGFGSVDLKVNNGLLHIETSESSSYIAGNYLAYDKIAELIEKTINSPDPAKALKELRANNNEAIQEMIQVLGKLGRQGVNVKSHIGTFCSEIGRKDLFPLLQKVGDARIVEMNKMYVAKKDFNLLKQIRSMTDEFRELETTSDGKVVFELREEFFGKDKLQRARIVAVNTYANAVSLISINKINDCINKVVLLGPFAHGVNEFVKRNRKLFGGAKDLPELIIRKIKTNIDAQHADLPSTEMLMKLYDFKIICDKDLNFPNNTFAADLFLRDKCQFTQGRGSWFSIPLEELKSKN